MSFMENAFSKLIFNAVECSATELHPPLKNDYSIKKMWRYETVEGLAANFLGLKCPKTKCLESKYFSIKYLPVKCIKTKCLRTKSLFQNCISKSLRTKC